MLPKLDSSELHLLMDDEFFVIDSSSDQALKVADQEQETDNPAEEELSLPFEYLGDFNKQIAILFKSSNKKEIDSTDKDFLFKILSSVNLTEQDVAVINTELFPDWQSNLDAQIIFDFTGGNGDYLVQENAGKKVLGCHPLSEIAKNVDLKRKLWASLKSLFTV